VAAPHAQLAESAPDAGSVGNRTGGLISVDRPGEVADRVLLVRLPGMQDAEVFRRGGLSPRVGMGRGGLGQPGRVLNGQAVAVRRGGGQGRVPGIGGGEGDGSAGDNSGQLRVAVGQRGADQPGRGGGVAQQQPGRGR